MIKFCFKLATCFWLLAPAIFLIGRWIGVWDYKSDMFVFGFLMIAFSITAYLNFDRE